MSRICARPGCRRVAQATLSYSYADGVVWVDVLTRSDHPMTHDMCVAHADGLVVPRGWTTVDRRASTTAGTLSVYVAV